MRKTIICLLFSAFTLTANSQDNLPDDWVETSLKNYGYGFSMILPSDVTFEETNFGLEIRSGEKFGLRIWTDRQSTSNVYAKYKKETDENKVWKLQKYLEKDDFGFLAEQKSGTRMGYNFYVIDNFKKLQPYTAEEAILRYFTWLYQTVVFTPITAGDYSYTEKDIWLMYKSVQSRKELEEFKPKVEKGPELIVDTLKDFSQNIQYIYPYLSKSGGYSIIPPEKKITNYENTTYALLGFIERDYSLRFLTETGNYLYDEKNGFEYKVVISSFDLEEFEKSFEKPMKKSGMNGFNYYVDQIELELSDLKEKREINRPLNFDKNTPLYLSKNSDGLGFNSPETVSVNDFEYKYFEFIGLSNRTVNYTYLYIFKHKNRVYTTELTCSYYKSNEESEKQRLEIFPTVANKFMNDLKRL